MVERKILYTNVPKNKKGYIWNKSIGCYIDFIYGDYSGRIEITDRIKPNKLKTALWRGFFNALSFTLQNGA